MKIKKLLLGIVGLFLVLQMENLCIFLAQTIYPAEGVNAIQWMIGWVFTCIAWGSGTFVIMRYFYKSGLCRLETKTVPMKGSILCIIASILFVMGFSEAVFKMGNIKMVAEVTNMYRYLGVKLGSAVFFGQYLYYAFEVALFLGILVLAQELGEQVFHSGKIPYGGIGLGLTWGLNHIFTQDVLTALFLLVTSVIMGICYLVFRKNIKYMYLTAYILFAVL